MEAWGVNNREILAKTTDHPAFLRRAVGNIMKETEMALFVYCKKVIAGFYFTRSG